MDNLLPPIPKHLATLGFLDNQIGLATLGYIVGPEITPRFPTKGQIQSDNLIGVVSEQNELVAQLEACEWLGIVDAPLDLSGIVDGLVWQAVLKEEELGGDIEVNKPYTGNIEEEGESQAEVEDCGDFSANVAEIDQGAEVSECDQVATVVEKPGEGGCC